jgi:hypothetical protein
MARIIDTDHFRSRAAAPQGTSGNGGGSVEDILKRLGIVESLVGQIRVDVSAIKAALPHLATKADLNAVEGSLSGRISTVEGSLSARINALETSIIQWIVGTVITVAALAFSIAKFVN